MATGRLGAADLSAAAYTTLYTAPASTFSVVSVNLCNRGASSVTVRVAVAGSATPTNSEFIEYDAELLPNGVLERTGVVMDAGKQIVVYSSGSSVSAVAMGIETSTV